MAERKRWRHSAPCCGQSLMVIRREWPSPQLSLYSYLLDQIFKDAILDTNKSICKSNLLHSGSWMPLTVLKWTPVSFPCCHLRDLGFTPQTGCWQCWFRGDEQRHRGCWDLAKGSQEVCGGCSKKIKQPKEWWTTTFHPGRREESQDLYRCLCQRAKAEPCFVVVPSPIHGDTLPALCHCASALHPSREADLRRTWLLNVPEEGFTPALKYWRCVWG